MILFESFAQLHMGRIEKYQMSSFPSDLNPSHKTNNLDFTNVNKNVIKNMFDLRIPSYSS